jgi:hypothetical protein
MTMKLDTGALLATLGRRTQTLRVVETSEGTEPEVLPVKTLRCTNKRLDGERCGGEVKILQRGAYQYAEDCRLCRQDAALWRAFDGLEPHPAASDRTRLALLEQSGTALRVPEVHAATWVAAASWLRRFGLDDRHRCGVLCGPSQTGKTALALRACRDVLAAPQGPAPVRFVPESSLLDAFASQYSDRADRSRWAEALIESVHSAQLLVLDEVGALSAPTQKATEFVTELVRRRLDAGLALLMTTNLSFARLCEIRGDRFGARLRGCCAVFEFPAYQWRKQ